MKGPKHDPYLSAVEPSGGVAASTLVARRGQGSRVEFPIIVMVAWRLGAIVTPVNPTFTADRAAVTLCSILAWLRHMGDTP